MKKLVLLFISLLLFSEVNASASRSRCCSEGIVSNKIVNENGTITYEVKATKEYIDPSSKEKLIKIDQIVSGPASRDTEHLIGDKVQILIWKRTTGNIDTGEVKLSYSYQFYKPGKLHGI